VCKASAKARKSLEGKRWVGGKSAQANQPLLFSSKKLDYLSLNLSPVRDGALWYVKGGQEGRVMMGKGLRQ